MHFLAESATITSFECVFWQLPSLFLILRNGTGSFISIGPYTGTFRAVHIFHYLYRQWVEAASEQLKSSWWSSCAAITSSGCCFRWCGIYALRDVIYWLTAWQLMAQKCKYLNNSCHSSTLSQLRCNIWNRFRATWPLTQVNSKHDWTSLLTL